MLLAGSGKPWASNYSNAPGSVNSGRPFSAPMAVPQSTTSRPGSPVPQAPTTSAAPIAVNHVLANRGLAKPPPVTHIGEYLVVPEPLQFLDHLLCWWSVVSEC